MSFALGRRSEENLVGVHPALIRVVRRAILITSIDFSVHDGIRTLEEQKRLVASGASTTLDSYHLTGDAVDLVPYVGGKLRWEMPLCHDIASAMREASLQEGVPLTWGRVWDRKLEELDPDDFDLERDRYVKRFFRAHPGRTRPPLDDGPHFQRVRA